MYFSYLDTSMSYIALLSGCIVIGSSFPTLLNILAGCHMNKNIAILLAVLEIENKILHFV